MFGKIISWLAQDIIVKSLVKSKSFQRLVFMIDSKFQVTNTKVTQTVDTVKKLSMPKVIEFKNQSSSFIQTFKKVFNEEMKKNQ